jgi:hypothetical protein
VVAQPVVAQAAVQPVAAAVAPAEDDWSDVALDEPSAPKARPAAATAAAPMAVDDAPVGMQSLDVPFSVGPEIDSFHADDLPVEGAASTPPVASAGPAATSRSSSCWRVRSRRQWRDVRSASTTCSRAARRRAMPIPPSTDVLRLVDDEGDGCGLVVDRYGTVLRSRCAAPIGPPRSTRPRARSAHRRPRARVGLLRTSAGSLKVLAGDPPRAHRHRGGRAAGAPSMKRRRPGRVVDHRGAARRAPRPQPTIVTCSRAGRSARCSGRRRVARRSADAARKCAPYALNLALNEDPRKHRFLVDDALGCLQLRQKGWHTTRHLRSADHGGAPDGSRFPWRSTSSIWRDCVRCLHPGGALLDQPPRAARSRRRRGRARRLGRAAHASAPGDRAARRSTSGRQAAADGVLAIVK